MNFAVPASIGTFDAYLNYVTQIPRLTPEEEKDLSFEFINKGDLEAAQKLVMSNLRFVIHVARGYSGYGLSFPDIIQEGTIGLMKAVKRFDPNMGVRLVSFAVHWIKAEINEFVIKNWGIVKVATTKAQRKLFFNLRKSKKDLGWLSGEDAQTIATDLNVKLSTVYEMESRLSGKDMPFEIDDSSEDYTAPECFLYNYNDDPAILLENLDGVDHDQDLLVTAMEKLDDRSIDILTSRWLNEEKSTLHDLAARYGISAERVRQLEQIAMKKIRSSIEA